MSVNKASGDRELKIYDIISISKAIGKEHRQKQCIIKETETERNSGILLSD